MSIKFSWLFDYSLIALDFFFFFVPMDLLGEQSRVVLGVCRRDDGLLERRQLLCTEV